MNAQTKRQKKKQARVACVHLPHVPVALEERDNLALVGRPLVIAGENPLAKSPSKSAEQASRIQQAQQAQQAQQGQQTQTAQADQSTQSAQSAQAAQAAQSDRRAVVIDLSYPAHAAGIMRGMRIDAARKICPDLNVLPARPQDYQDAFALMLEILGEITPDVEPADLEHSWLSTHGLLPEGGREQSLVTDLARRVRAATGLNVRAGLAHGKLTSRILTAYLNQRDVMVLPAGKEVRFLGGLATRYLPLGSKNLERLTALGIRRVFRYAALPRRGILPRFGYSGLRAYDLAHGHDEAAVRPWAEEPLLTAETTFPEAIRNMRSLEHHIGQLCARISHPLIRQYRMASHMQLRIEFERGQAAEHQREIIEPVSRIRSLQTHAEALMREVKWGAPVESIRLAVRGLCPSVSRQLALFQYAEESREGIEKVLGQVEARYGEGVVQRGRPCEPESPLHERRAVLVPYRRAG